MNTLTKTLLLMCFLAPLLAEADPLEVYGNLTGKTILAPSTLPALTDAIASDLPPDKTNAIARIESEMARQGIAVVNDGPHFVRLIRERERDFWKSLPLHGEELTQAKAQTNVAAGDISLLNVNVDDVLRLYGSISQRTVLRPIGLPSPPVRLTTTCPLTRNELSYAMQTVLALNGIAVVEDGERFAQVVPIPQRARLTTRAPKPDPAAKLLDPNKVPSTGHSDPPKPLTKLEQEIEQWRKALYDFIHYKSPPDRSAQRLLDLYAKLAGKTAESSKDFDGVPIWFHIDIPLSNSELLYAIETTFSLNNLTIINTDDKGIRLDRIAGAPSRNRRPDEKPQIPRQPQKPVAN